MKRAQDQREALTKPMNSEGREELAKELLGTVAGLRPNEMDEHISQALKVADFILSREKSLQAKLERVRNLLTELSYAQHNALCRKSKGTRFHFECWACRASKALDEISKEVK